MKPSVHYSEQPPAVSLEQQSSTTADGGVSSRLVCARLQGFITAPVLDSAFSELELGLLGLSTNAEPEAATPRGGGGDGDADTIPADVLCDVSEVSGYGADAPRLARRWLTRAERSGVRKIAFVASSSVLRTTVELLQGRTAVDLGCFSSEAGARDWLTRS